MTGPEHYRWAERLLERAADAEGMAHEENLSARAQTHATLALVAATMDVAGATVNGVVTAGWSEAIA